MFFKSFCSILPWPKVVTATIESKSRFVGLEEKLFILIFSAVKKPQFFAA